MAAYFLGLRVRIKHANGKAAHLVGMETRIVGEGDGGGIMSLFFPREVWILDLPAPHAGGRWTCWKDEASTCLEPILPDGHRACEEDFQRDLDRVLERQGVPA